VIVLKRELRGIAIGILITLMITTAFATGITRTISVQFNSVNLEVNGQRVEADTLLYDGVTYVPLRAAAEILDKEVGWDGTTRTASINDKGEKAVVVPDEPDDSSEQSDSGSATLGEKNALSKAKQYLRTMPFSKEGLLTQLEFEGFSYDEALYGVNNCDADWYEQAALKAEQYLSMMSFSRQGLIEQLEYEGFTYDQAVYGVEAVGY
jgi:hypothetical protein